MLPALLAGWKFHRVIVQDGDAWRGYKRDAIVADKLTSGYANMAPDLGEFREKLLAIAASGVQPKAGE
jgi:hypothetical protein